MANNLLFCLIQNYMSVLYSMGELCPAWLYSSGYILSQRQCAVHIFEGSAQHILKIVWVSARLTFMIRPVDKNHGPRKCCYLFYRISIGCPCGVSAAAVRQRSYRLRSCACVPISLSTSKCSRAANQ